MSFEDHTPVALGDDTTKLTVRNTTTSDETVALQLVIPGLKAGDGTEVTASKAYVLPAPTTVVAGGMAELKLIPSDHIVLKPGKYGGTITLVNERFTDTLTATLVVAQDTSTLEPLLKKWKAEEVFRAPRFRWPDLPKLKITYRDLDIPLKDGPKAFEKKEPSLELGTLQGSHGGGLVVSGRVVEEADNAYLRLSFAAGPDGAPRGKYEGTIDVQPDDEKKGDVTLTVVARDEWVLPALVLLISLLLVWLAQRWFTVREVFYARLDVERAMKALKSAPAPVGGLSLAPDATVAFAVAAKDHRKRVWRRAALPTAKAKDRAAVQADVATAQAALETWTGAVIGAHVTALTAAISVRRATLPKPPWDVVQPEPAFLIAAEELLTGTDLGVSDISARDTAIKEMDAFSTTWGELVGQVNACQDRLDLLANPQLHLDAREQRLLAGARGTLSGVKADMWAATDAKDLAKRTTIVELERADAAIGQLSYLVAPPRLLLYRAFGGGQEIRTADAFAGIIHKLAPLAAELGTAASSELQRVGGRVIDGWLVVVAGVVSIAAAMAAKYTGEGFGRLSDYFGLIVWAFATSTALTAVDAVFAKLAPPDPTDGAAAKDATAGDAAVAPPAAVPG